MKNAKDLNLATAELTTECVIVTPDVARTWLERNVRNRGIRTSKVSQHARDMQAGRWLVTGESIKFSPEGILLDGQHRLAAIIRADVPVMMLVQTGIPTESQRVMDTGAKRKVADHLAIDGEESGTLVAATARLALVVQHGNEGRRSPSHMEILEFVEKNPEIRKYVSTATTIAKRTDCTPTVVVYTSWRLAQLSEDEALLFWRDASRRVGLFDGDPVLAMTDRFADWRRTNTRVSRQMWLNAIYRAWNARRAGKTLASIVMYRTINGVPQLQDAPEPR